jgi:hypothetical protein
LKGKFCCNNLKWEIANFVAKCYIWQRMKVEHRSLAWLLYALPIPEWQCEENGTYFRYGYTNVSKVQDHVTNNRGPIDRKCKFLLSSNLFWYMWDASSCLCRWDR